MSKVNAEKIYKRISAITALGKPTFSIPEKIQDNYEMQSTSMKKPQGKELSEKVYIRYTRTDKISVCMPLKDETLLTNTTEKTNFMGQKQQLKAFLKKVPSDFFESDRIFIPVVQCHSNKNHLVLVVIDKTQKKINFYDSNPARTVGVFLCCKSAYPITHIQQAIQKKLESILKDITEYSWSEHYIGSQPWYSRDQEGEHITAIAWLVAKQELVTKEAVHKEISRLKGKTMQSKDEKRADETAQPFAPYLRN